MDTQGRLWKNEYNIGEKKIDAQHYQLFYKIERLLYIAKSNEPERLKQECNDIIEFLISYTIEHFAVEEAYQKKIKYVSYEKHKKIHDNFKNTVVLYQKQLNEDFSTKTLKAFIGTLLTWLVVHVCNCDKKIVKNEPLEPNITFNNVEDIIKNVAKKVMCDTYNIHINSIKTYMYKGFIDGKVFIKSLAMGDKNHVFIYGLSEELTQNIYTKMTSMSIKNIEALDEIESSAIKEMCNILSSYAIGIITKDNVSAIKFKENIYVGKYDTDSDLRNSVVVSLDTSIGKIEIMYCVK